MSERCGSRGAAATSWVRRRVGWATPLAVVLLGFACSRSPIARLPEVSVPLELTPTPEPAEEPTPGSETEGGNGAAGAPAGRSGPGQGPRGRAPDPPALTSTVQYELELRYARGDVELVGAEERRFQRPRVTPRRIGRFAIELWIGLELVERVRFDFPLLGAEESEDGGLERGLVTSQKVLVPATDRPTRALLVDRATGEEIELPWPPLEAGPPQDEPNPSDRPRPSGDPNPSDRPRPSGDPSPPREPTRAPSDRDAEQ